MENRQIFLDCREGFSLIDMEKHVCTGEKSYNFTYSDTEVAFVDEKGEVHIKKSSLRMARLLYYGGLTVIFLLFLCWFWRTTVAAGHMAPEWLEIILYVWFKEILLSGLILSAVGCVWKSRLYHCPICRNWILRFGGLSQKPSKYCSRCGTKIDVCVDD